MNKKIMWDTVGVSRQDKKTLPVRNSFMCMNTAAVFQDFLKLERLGLVTKKEDKTTPGGFEFKLTMQGIKEALGLKRYKFILKNETIRKSLGI